MYNEKPIIKLYKYTTQFELVAFIDDYESISITENKYESSEFTLTINFNIPNARLFEKRLFIQFGDDEDRFFRISAVNDVVSQGGKGSQVRTVTGYDCRYLFHQRYIVNLNNANNWTYTGTGEACIRNLVDSQCGINASEKRRLNVNNDLESPMSLGKEYTVAEAYSNLYDVIVTIATQSEIGWKVTFKNNELWLEVYEGENKSNTIFLSSNYETMQDGSYTDSTDSFCNIVYVGGKGEGQNKDLYEGKKLEVMGYLLLSNENDFLLLDNKSKLILAGGEAEGFDRFETFDNANSLDNENAYINESKSVLSQYGQSIECSGNFLAKSPYVYKKDMFIGDFISLGFNDKKEIIEILGVTETWQWGSYEISFELGKPRVDLSRQLEIMVNNLQTYQATAKETKTSGKKWYDLPNVLEQTKEDVVYDTIGFTGNIGLGATFKLYKDENNVGAKSYHLYLKGVSGSGTITLTTGILGTETLSISGGTYVTIIEVDEDGNVYSATNLNSGFVTTADLNSRLDGMTNIENTTSNDISSLFSEV